MIELRANSELTILRKVSGCQEAVVSVLITAASTRRYMLMSDDYVELRFSLAEAVPILIGDYINDPIFGYFYITQEQMPKYNTRTGGYDYTLRFDSHIFLFANYIHTLVIVKDSSVEAIVETIQSESDYLSPVENGQVVVATAASVDHVFERMEASWSLTDKLLVHAEQVLLNIKAIYYDLDYIVAIHPSATKAAEVKFLSYAGVTIIEGLNMMAAEWQCEWWVTHETVTDDGSSHMRYTIHFGKCELDNTAYDFKLCDNVESMDIARDQQEYANRIYAYGGTQNVPETYDRELVFELDDVTNQGYLDSSKPLTVDMVDGDATIQKIGLVFGAYSVDDTVTNKKVFTSETNTAFVNSGKVSVNGVVATRCFNISQHFQADCVVTLHLGATSKVISTGIVRTGKVCQCNARVDEELNLSAPVAISIDVEWTIIKPSASSEVFNPLVEDFSGVEVVPDVNEGSIGIIVQVGDNTYNATLDGQTGRFTFDDEAPDNFGLGEGQTKRYTINNLNLNVPLSYYAPRYDTGTMSKVNDRRIHLPLENYPHRYAESSTPNDAAKVVERCVLFEKIFPKLNLRVTSVTAVQKKEKIEHEDGTVTWEQWTQYSIKVTKTTQTGGEYDPFDFKASYLMDQAKLQAVFTAPDPETSQSSGFMLAGMTFDLGMDGTEYLIIRNEDYGAKLPNDILMPCIGDELFFTGWNPNAMKDLGLISDAEDKLAEEVENYLKAIQDGQFTFTCKMMSNWVFDLEAERFVVLPHDPMTVMDEEAFYVSNGYERYRLLRPGSRVKVHHDALPGDEHDEHYKESRVIGYECKLDKPYDTPTYIVGETEAYSRLKQLEKKITKLS